MKPEQVLTDKDKDSAGVCIQTGRLLEGVYWIKRGRVQMSWSWSSDENGRQRLLQRPAETRQHEETAVLQQRVRSFDKITSHETCDLQ